MYFVTSPDFTRISTFFLCPLRASVMALRTSSGVLTGPARDFENDVADTEALAGRIAFRINAGDDHALIAGAGVLGSCHHEADAGLIIRARSTQSASILHLTECHAHGLLGAVANNAQLDRGARLHCRDLAGNLSRISLIDAPSILVMTSPALRPALVAGLLGCGCAIRAPSAAFSPMLSASSAVIDWI